MKKKVRDNNLDFLRGIAALSVIIIHTAWWSGTTYLPEWFSNLTLLLDVPVFIFISGVSFNYVNSIIKNIKGLLIQWKKYLYFMLFYILIMLIFFREQFALKEILSWIIYVFPNYNGLKVVGGSIWYMIMFIKVTIICSIIIYAINQLSKKDNLNKIMTVALLFLMIFLYTDATNTPFLAIDSYVSYYSFIYLLGYIAHHYKIENKKKLMILELTNSLVIFIIFFISKLRITDIQNIKFPPSAAYLPISLISILFFWYLKDNLKIKENNIINKIGKNALFYYFAQGISSSLLYFIYKYIPFKNIVLKFSCMLLLNIIIATIIAVFLEKSYNYITKKMKCEKIKAYLLPIKK